MNLPVFDDAQVTSLTPWPALIHAIREAFLEGAAMPDRHHHEIPGAQREDITLLLMPAWRASGAFGVKLASIARGNAKRGLPTLNGVYIVFDGDTGRPQALLDAGALTARRTAAASALASQALSKPTSRTLLVIGTGRVAQQLIFAHCAVRPIETVLIWGRNPEHTAQRARDARAETGLTCRPVTDLPAAASAADIISSAVPTTEPVLRGAWVSPGTHIDLVGAFKPSMCEADPALIAMADPIFVDTLSGAREEAGDLIQAEQQGRFSFAEIAGDLGDLARAGSKVERQPDAVTLYKSVGVALQDLAAAQLCLANSER